MTVSVLGAMSGSASMYVPSVFGRIDVLISVTDAMTASASMENPFVNLPRMIAVELYVKCKRQFDFTVICKSEYI